MSMDKSRFRFSLEISILDTLELKKMVFGKSLCICLYVRSHQTKPLNLFWSNLHQRCIFRSPYICMKHSVENQTLFWPSYRLEISFNVVQTKRLQYFWWNVCQNRPWVHNDLYNSFPINMKTFTKYFFWTFSFCVYFTNLISTNLYWTNYYFVK